MHGDNVLGHDRAFRFRHPFIERVGQAVMEAREKIARETDPVGNGATSFTVGRNHRRRSAPAQDTQ
jgi:hypothetical protein